MPTASERKQLSSHSSLCRGLRPCDHPLEPGQEPPLGAHIVTPRRVYSHHGIYAGQGTVLQYGGGLRRGPVEEVSLWRFSQGRQIWIRPGAGGLRDRPEVVRRARSRLGENCYHPLRNNCEHFCEWCVRGQHRSYQVDAFAHRFGKGWLAGSLARFFRERYVHGYGFNVTSADRRNQGVLPARNSLLVNGTITAEVTERTSQPPTCSVTWLAGRFSARRPFLQRSLAR